MQRKMMQNFILVLVVMIELMFYEVFFKFKKNVWMQMAGFIKLLCFSIDRITAYH